MSKYEKMTIPAEADGIVDDEWNFNEQIAKNEAQLTEEIEAARQEAEDQTSELQLDGFQDMEYVPHSETTTSEKALKLAKRRSILGKRTIRLANVFARMAS